MSPRKRKEGPPAGGAFGEPSLLVIGIAVVVAVIVVLSAVVHLFGWAH